MSVRVESFADCWGRTVERALFWAAEVPVQTYFLVVLLGESKSYSESYQKELYMQSESW